MVSVIDVSGFMYAYVSTVFDSGFAVSIVVCDSRWNSCADVCERFLVFGEGNLSSCVDAV